MMMIIMTACFVDDDEVPTQKKNIIRKPASE